jgi:hypothetical protein
MCYLAFETQVFPSGTSSDKLRHSLGCIFYQEAVTITHLLVRRMPIATMVPGVEYGSRAHGLGVIPEKLRAQRCALNVGQLAQREVRPLILRTRDKVEGASKRAQTLFNTLAFEPISDVMTLQPDSGARGSADTDMTATLDTASDADVEMFAGVQHSATSATAPTATKAQPLSPQPRVQPVPSPAPPTIHATRQLPLPSASINRNKTTTNTSTMATSTNNRPINCNASTTTTTKGTASISRCSK